MYSTERRSPRLVILGPQAKYYPFKLARLSLNTLLAGLRPMEYLVLQPAVHF